ncbi:MAG: DUF488 family protein, partial [Gammaproteobacteria bacterium]|nr:DUF488 family protein [Gammaproteobacteria bacterium]
QRAYDYVRERTKSDAHVVLVDRLWPRGLSKESMKEVEWLRELAPSNGLRKWFGHHHERWQEFATRYRDELRQHESELQRLRSIARKERLVLLYGARDREHNQAVVLEEIIANGDAASGTDS